MNFRTTVVLLVLLGIIGVVLLVTRDRGEAPAAPAETRLLDISAADVNNLVIASDGQRVALHKAEGKWRLSEPVRAAADEAAVSMLISAITALQSRAQVEAGEGTGLSEPRYKLELTTSGGKTTRLDIGARSATGDNLYVRREGQSMADVVAATLIEQLDKPVSDWRQAKLFDIQGPQIAQLRVATTQQSIAMEKHGQQWQMTAPTSMPADASAVSDMTIAVANLRAAEFIEATPQQIAGYGLEQPTMTVAFSTTAPSTQPAATQPTLTMVQFGRYEDVLKQNVYASIVGEPGVFKVAASVLDTFQKQPIELRDKQVLNIEPEKVSRIEITIDKAATTQPTTREASKETVVLEQFKEMAGPFLATTGPSSAPATTQADVEVVEDPQPQTKWVVASKDRAEADQTKVKRVIDSLHPLRATKFVDAAPPASPATTVTLNVQTDAGSKTVRFIDPGSSGSPIAEAEGLRFEVTRMVFDNFLSDFTQIDPPAPAMPSGMPAGMPSFEQP